MRLVEKLYSFYRLKEMQRFYKKHAVSFQEIQNTEQKYVFYAMHFEPEAGTGVIMDLQNQLSVIQMLHSSLPKGWKLYIKEHPHQLDINNVREHFFLTNFQFFKDKGFYEEVLKFENIVLIDYDTSSKMLMRYAQAIATINGSIILESVHNAKPCITFDNALMPITQCGIFENIHIFSTPKNLRDFLQKLENGISYKHPTREQYEELARFYFNHSKPEIILETIKMDLAKNLKIMSAD